MPKIIRSERPGRLGKTRIEINTSPPLSRAEQSIIDEIEIALPDEQSKLTEFVDSDQRRVIAVFTREKHMASREYRSTKAIINFIDRKRRILRRALMREEREDVSDEEDAGDAAAAAAAAAALAVDAAEAGELDAVTVSTNISGRGTDILLGGNSYYRTKRQIFTFLNEIKNQKLLLLKKNQITNIKKFNLKTLVSLLFAKELELNNKDESEKYKIHDSVNKHSCDGKV
jgi:preprotein translocase subunit SecA